MSGKHAILCQPELVLEIAEDCDVCTLIALAAVSASLHHLLMNSRSLWLFVLRRVAFEEGIAPLSIPLQLMSTHDLIRYATRPARLSSALRPGANCRVPSHEFVLRPAPTSYSSEDQLRVAASSVTLLPGGRWLVGGLLNEHHIICEIACWDLQDLFDSDRSNSDPQEHQLFPVTRIAWEGCHTVEIEVKPVCSNQSMDLLVRVPATSTAVLLQLIWPDGPQPIPELRQLFSNPFHSGICGLQIDGDICVSYNRNKIFARNWRQWSSAAFVSPYPGSNRQIDAVSLNAVAGVVSVLSHDSESVDTYALPSSDGHDAKPQVFKHLSQNKEIEWDNCNRNFILYNPAPYKRISLEQAAPLIWHRTLSSPTQRPGYTTSFICLQHFPDGRMEPVGRYDFDGSGPGERMQLIHPELAILLDVPAYVEHKDAKLLTVPVTAFSLKCGGTTAKLVFTTTIDDINEGRPSYRTRPGLCPVSGRMLLHRRAFRDQAQFRLVTFL